jgi:hypothetical protein
MLFSLLAITAVVLAIDWAAFWKFGNWVRQFRDRDPKFTYITSLFPRVVFTIIGCVVLVIAKQRSDYRIPLFIASVFLIGCSHAYLYYRAFRESDAGGDLK